MAFISMIFIFLIIIIMILIAIALAGASIIIISLIRRYNAKKKGKKPKKAGLITGFVLLSIPFAIVSTLIVSGVVSSIKLHFERLNYNNFVDKWKNEYVSDYKARNEAIDEFLKAADNSDIEAISAMFSDNIQKDPQLEIQINEFLKEYPAGLSAIDYECKGAGSIGSGGDGTDYEAFSADCEITTAENTYYIYFSAVTEDEANPENIGLQNFQLRSKEAEAMLDRENYSDNGSDLYIFAKTIVNEEIKVKKINGRLYEYKDIKRNITKEQAEKTSKNSQHMEDIIDVLGMPNADSGDYAVYELKADEPCYLIINYDVIYKRIYHAYFWNETDSSREEIF